MSEKNSSIRLALAFVVMLLLAMSLQSIVVVILSLKNSIRDDVIWSTNYLEQIVTSTLSGYSNVDINIVGRIISSNADKLKAFSCVSFDPAEKHFRKTLPCMFTKKISNMANQARDSRSTVVGFIGGGWYSFLSMSEAFIISVPLKDINYQVIGVVTAERSLVPIYSRITNELRIVACYLIVNAIIFGIMYFFRMQRMFFRPLDKLIGKAECYHLDEQNFSFVSDDESPLRKLSARLNTLFARIESDNKVLRRNIIELERVNAELKIKNDMVIRSEKLALVGRLSAGLAHEIGNPLSIIQGYVELLGREDLTGNEKSQFTERAQQELDRIKRLIRQLLEFAGPIKGVAESVFINEVIKDVIRFISMEKSCAECSISMRLLKEDVAIIADKDALKQVLMNCLLNAVDATAALEEQRREVVISTFHEEHMDEEKSLLIISIKDNGTGITDEQLEHVFDPFYTTKEVGKGTGLGLFVCHTIIERIGGTIALHNRSPHGVEVRIALPLKRMIDR